MTLYGLSMTETMTLRVNLQAVLPNHFFFQRIFKRKTGFHFS